MPQDSDGIKVSVIVPVYNSEKYLKECLQSIGTQSLRGIEILCVDNASIDNSANIIQDYCLSDSRFVYIRNETNRGQAYSRNVYWRRRRGLIYALLIQMICCARGHYWIYISIWRRRNWMGFCLMQM